MSVPSDPQSSPPESPASSTPLVSWFARLRSRPHLALITVLIVLVIITAITYIVIQSQRDNVPLGPQQTVTTINPKMGIHTRLTDEVEPWKIKHTLEMVRQMGAPWIVEYFPWAYVEGQPGQFGWNHT